MDKADVVALTDDDQQAEALAMALLALRPANTVSTLPASDALPGDPTSASPGNIGARIAALRSARLIRGEARASAAEMYRQRRGGRAPLPAACRICR